MGCCASSLGLAIISSTQIFLPTQDGVFCDTYEFVHLFFNDYNVDLDPRRLNISDSHTQDCCKNLLFEHTLII